MHITDGCPAFNYRYKITERQHHNTAHSAIGNNNQKEKTESMQDKMFGGMIVIPQEALQLVEPHLYFLLSH